ncbi:MAG TPA: glycosyltransferase family 4 protein [Acidimicrobiia bacterium]|jgi:glycosyltransferase involved in cell wall biosynthesis
MPRVLVSFPHALGAPGIGATAWHQVVGARDAGVDVVAYAASVHTPVTIGPAPMTTLTVAGRRVPHRALGVARAYRLHDRLVARALRRQSAGVDLVHVWPAACMETLRAARDLGIPSLREAPSAHTAEVFDQAAAESRVTGVELPPGHPLRFDSARLRLEEQEFEAAGGLLVPSQPAADTFLTRGFGAERVVRHRYGYDPDRFRPMQRPDGPFTAVFVGRCEPPKGLHYALDAWFASGAAERGRFVVVGAMQPDYERFLGARLTHRSLEVRPFDPDVAELLGVADALVLPTVTEGSALVTYEATGSGCVPVVSDAAGAYCTDGLDGLVHRARDVGALTEHLRILSTDAVRLEELRQGVLAHRPELTWQRAGEVLAAAYADRLS